MRQSIEHGPSDRFGVTVSTSTSPIASPELPRKAVDDVEVPFLVHL